MTFPCEGKFTGSPFLSAQEMFAWLPLESLWAKKIAWKFGVVKNF